MRGVKGLDRPAAQWALVGLGIVLIVVALLGAVAVRRERMRSEDVRASMLQAALERDELRMRFDRERSAREALAVEVGRLRGQSAQGDSAPTLTLLPLKARGGTPPEPTLAPPAPSQTIALRLVLPAGADPRGRFSISMRDWSGGQAMLTRGGLAAETIDGRPMVVARIAGDVLARGTYEVALLADGPDGPPREVGSYELAIRSP